MDGNRHSYKESLSVEEQQSADEISSEQLQRLVHLLDKSDVSEIEVKRVSVGMRLVLRKAKAAEGSNLQVAVPPSVDVEEPASPVDTKHAVTAPLVGVFHSWAKPRGASLVSVGDTVKAGQRVGTIQSLNVLNEVETPVGGRVVEILVEDGHPVEYGQPLMTIDSVEEA
jgi:acetyl-CoA carboxylase biotin carboxyl carrier protein